jgi:F-type H+-transporting ATPase subunit epsilon
MIHFRLVAQTGVKFDDQVYEVVLPTVDGQIAVLNDHMPIVTVIDAGVLMIRRDSKDPDSKLELYATYGGVIDVKDNQLEVLVDEADHADSLDQAEAELAYDKAVALKNQAKDAISLNHAQSLLDRSQVRLQVINLRKHIIKK